MTTSGERPDAIAVVGMAGRFPGAGDVRSYWENLNSGTCSIIRLDEDEVVAYRGDPSVLSDPSFVPAGAPLEDADAFDAEFFGYHPREAELTDPQQRVLLETAWLALEDAGHDPSRFDGLIAVFAGVARNTYLLNLLNQHGELLRQAGEYATMIGSEKDFPATRIAFKLDLRGPAINVQTACSTSGVAIHLACQSLLAGDCDMALAGGARIEATQRAGYWHEEGGVLSPDGTCRPFDASARGTVRGSGSAFVVLRRYEDALRDGDTIHALVLGSAINNDGSAKAGFTAPAVRGQADAIADALAAADVSADTIGYVEAHGTATPLGDPIEVAALTRAFRETTDRIGYCLIGSAKSNIGHLDAGAAVAGVIKAVLALENGVIPPSLGFVDANPEIPFADSPFRVVARLTPWPSEDHPRRAGVSSFGLGGTNAHIVLEAAPEPSEASARRAWHLLPVSARTPEALSELADRLADRLDEEPSVSIADAAYTLQQGRRALPVRLSVCATDPASAVEALREAARREPTSAGARELVFVFPGVGCQHAAMGQGLYAEEPMFRAAFHDALDHFEPAVAERLHRVVSRPDPEEDTAALQRPGLAMPGIFAVEYALVSLWESWGIRPGAVLGHSAGEYVAACLSGVMDLKDAAGLIALRGRLFDELPSGSMLSVPLPESELTGILPEGLSIAVVNHPSTCVASGPSSLIDELQRTLEDRDIDAARLHIDVACHSAMVDPILDDFRDAVRKIPLRTPKLMYVSSMTGTRVTDELTDPEYWVDHLRRPVRFADAVSVILDPATRMLLEVGPGRTLTAIAGQHPDRKEGQPVLASMRHPREEVDDQAVILRTLGHVWSAGVEPDWSAFVGDERRRRISLPGYPFARTRFWLGELPRDIRPAAPSDQMQDYNAAPSPASAPQPPAGAGDRPTRIAVRLKEILHELSGVPAEGLGDDQTFVEMGFDSLFLTRANGAFRKEFGVRTTFRELFNDAPTPRALAEFLDERMPAGKFPPPAPALAPAPASAPAPAASESVPALPTAAEVGPAGIDVGRLIQDQMQLMQRQLDSVRLMLTGSVPASLSTAAPAEATPRATPAATDTTAESSAADARGFGPFRPIKRPPSGDLTPEQRAWLEDLIQRYNERTKTSKELVSAARTRVADPRAVSGFRPLWKEIVYPIASARSHGSRIVDVDGNEYVDLVMGFGSNLLGHSPPFVTEAIQAQLERGVELGTLMPEAAEVAELICELTGAERVTFSNSGSEAVLGALRVARTVTGRDRIALFAGSYHGRVDCVMVRPVTVDGVRRSVPQVPGIPDHMVEDVLVLDYGDPASFETLRRHSHELACVLVEPIQSRNPALQPKEFLLELRKVTEELDIPLVFDEMITGFRCHPGGAQAWFGVQADIAAYGKAVGGGMPISVIAGRAEFIDAFDGGHWAFGDDSFPAVGVTFLGGTHVKHPTAITATRASLLHLKEQGPDLQRALNERSSAFVEELNEHCEEFGYPLRLDQFSSLFIVGFDTSEEYSGLFFPMMRHRGVHVYEDYPCFLSTAHSDADVRQILDAARDSLAELHEIGLLSGRTSAVATPRVGTAAEAHTLPMTPGQTEIWLACQLGGEPASCAYMLSSRIELTGQIDPDALHEALVHVVRSRDALRATFDPLGETMRIAREIDLQLPVVDLSVVSGSDRDSSLADLLDEETRTAFDLENGPLLRATLVRMRSDRHLLLLTCHHLVCDGWSLGLVLRDVASAYRAEREGRTAELTGPAYVEYTDALEDAEEDRRISREYWLSRYEQLPPALELPSDRTRPRSRSWRSERSVLRIEPEVRDRIYGVARREGYTPFAALLAAWHAVLARLSGQSDVVIGLFTAGQSALGVPDVVGHAVSLLPFRFDTGLERPYAEHVKAVAEELLDTYDSRYVTLGEVLSELDVPRDPSRPPLVSATFTLEQAVDELDFGAVEARLENNTKAFCNFDVELYATDGREGLGLECHFNADLFDRETVDGWLELLRHTLRTATQDSRQAVGAVTSLPGYQRETVLQEWNATSREYDPGSVVAMVRERCSAHPDRVAVRYGDRCLTYGELDRRSDALARYLETKGVRSGDLVGICVERSEALPSVLLGVLKTGAAYVPLDPDFPADRLTMMLEDSGTTIVVTQSAVADRVAGSEVETVSLDGDAEALAAVSTEPVESAIDPESRAYLIYTSGSTGRPNGVQVPHRAVTNFLRAMAERPGMSDDDVLLAVTTLSFDISVLELFLPLAVGGTVVVAPQTTTMDGAALSRLLVEEAVTHMQATPATWRLMLEAGWSGAPQLTALVGGEALPEDLAVALSERVGSLWNMYGPTETTVWSTCTQITGAGQPTLGRPIANTTLWVLDDGGLPTPIGAPGELHIGGAGVTLGYLDRQELNAERFVENPVPGHSGLLYRTGDLVRYRKDGELVFLGRSDTQVKVRGFRIEIAEVETALADHDDVRQAVVVVQGRDAEARLVAYVVPEPGRPVVGSELRGFLRHRLPNYMVPGIIAEIDTLPLTPNGKIDRNALPDPLPALESGAERVPAETDLEEEIVEIWRDVLKTSSIGVEDDFFELGGSSLQAARVVNRLQQRLDVRLSAAAIFDLPTVRSMAAYVVDHHPHAQTATPADAGGEEREEVTL